MLSLVILRRATACEPTAPIRARLLARSRHLLLLLLVRYGYLIIGGTERDETKCGASAQLWRY